MSRTGENVLSIISIVTNFLSLGFLIFFIFVGNMLKNDHTFIYEMENEFAGSGLSQAEIDSAIQMSKTMVNLITGIGWLFLIVVIGAIVLTIVGLVKMKSNAKTAGILFLVASFFSGVLSISGILLIITGIMCFVRKEDQHQSPTHNQVDYN